jgi:Ca2+-transporting ATPase
MRRKAPSRDCQADCSPRDQPDLTQLLLCGLLCNDAVLQKEQGEWAILGDPTEGALVVLAGKAGFNQTHLTQALPRVAEIPFSSERKRMSVVVAVPKAAADPDLAE